MLDSSSSKMEDNKNLELPSPSRSLQFVRLKRYLRFLQRKIHHGDSFSQQPSSQEIPNLVHQFISEQLSRGQVHPLGSKCHPRIDQSLVLGE